MNKITMNRLKLLVVALSVVSVMLAVYAGSMRRLASSSFELGLGFGMLYGVEVYKEAGVKPVADPVGAMRSRVYADPRVKFLGLKPSN